MRKKEISEKIKEIQKKFDKINRIRGNKEFLIYPFNALPFIDTIKKEKDKDRTPVERKGFKIELLQISPSEKHSQNIKDYIDQRWSSVILKDAIENKIQICLFKGTLARSFYWLYKKGYRNFFKIKTPRNEDLFAVFNSEGMYLYAMTSIFGEDKLTHIQGFLHFFKSDGKHINQSLITTYDFNTNYFAKMKGEFKFFFKGKNKAAAAIIDGKNNTYRILKKRFINKKRFDLLKEAFGANIKENLLSSIPEEKGYEDIKKIVYDKKYEKLFSIKNTKLIFQRHEYTDLCDDFFARLMQVQYNYPSLTSLKIFNWDIFPLAKEVYGLYLNYNILKYKDKKGKLNFLINAQIPFGEIAADMVNLFLTENIDLIFFYGSAGALGRKYEVGDLLFPSSYYNEKGSLIGADIPNVLNDFIKNKRLSRERVYTDTKHVTVSSPTKEIIPFVKTLIKSGFDEVEVELSPIIESIKRFKETKARKVNFGAGFVIPNVHLTKETLAEYETIKPKLTISSERFFDILIDYLGIQDLVEFEKKDVSYKIIKKTENTITLFSEGKKYKLIFYDSLQEGRRLYLANLIILKIKLGVPLNHTLNTHKVRVIKF